VRNLSGLHDDGGSLDTVANFYDPDALQTRRTFTRNKARLPPLDVARRLFAVQYTYIGTIFSFTDPEAFERSLPEAYQGLPEGAGPEIRLAYAKVLMILAFGKLYSINQWIDFKGPPGFDYFTAAVDLLPDVHEQGSILYAETLAYVGYFMQNMNRRDAAFLYIGMALRMAISLGLHQEVTSAGLDEIALEHRRRVWWSIYSLVVLYPSSRGIHSLSRTKILVSRCPLSYLVSPTTAQQSYSVTTRNYRASSAKYSPASTAKHPSQVVG
jgi:proline utilization trans-activator